MLSAAAERVLDPGLVHRYLALFAPGLVEHPRRYLARMLVEEEAKGWHTRRGADPVRTVVQALMAGADGLGELTGCAVRQYGNDQTHVVRLDIDGGDAQAIVHELAARYGDDALLVTRSRRQGHFHVLMRLREPLTVEEAHERTRHLIQGVTQHSDRVEAFPRPNLGLRLPFGVYGCNVVDDHDDLSRTRRHHPWELLDCARRLTPVELPRAPLQRRRPRRRASYRFKRRTCRDADRLIRRGIEPGARDRGERTLIIALHTRGVPRGEAVSRMRRYIYGGLIDHTHYALVECHGDIERAREGRAADMERRVRSYYDRYLQALPRPAHLSAYDVMAVELHAQERSAVTGIPVRDLRVFLYRVLPMFKASALAGLPELQWHHTHWQDAATHSRYGYAVLRRAAGVFSTDGSYLPEQHAARPDDAHAMRWHVAWQFDRQVPRRGLHTGPRPLTGGVAVAVGAARRRMARGYQPEGLVAQPARRAPTAEFEQPPPRVGDQIPFPLVVVGTSTRPGRRRGLVAETCGPVATTYTDGLVVDVDRDVLKGALASGLSADEEDCVLRELGRRASARLQGSGVPP